MDLAERVRNRSPKNLWGKPLVQRFKELQELALKKQLDKESQDDEARCGKEHDRRNPVPGSTVIIPDEKIAEMQEAIISNGLPRFEGRTAVRISCKSLGAIPAILVPPVSSLQGIVHDPAGSTAELQINVLDVLFPSHDGSIPSEFVQAVLNGMNPAMTVRLVQKDIREYLARAYHPDNVKWVGNVVASTAIAWSKRDAPSDLATLQAYAAEGLLHEYCHGLILCLPAGDIPPGQSGLQDLTLEKYITLVFGDSCKPLHGGVVMFKNVLKALRTLRDRTPCEQTRDEFLRVTAIEMFCDRFGMYLFENHLKSRIYHEIPGPTVGDLADPERVDSAELARAEGKLDAHLRAQNIAVGASGLAELESSLRLAESAHVYISRYGDPPLLPVERTFFLQVLRHFRGLDKQGSIARFSPRHAATSTPIHMMPLLSGAQ